MKAVLFLADFDNKGTYLDNNSSTAEDELGLIYILVGSVTVLFAISLLLGEFSYCVPLLSLLYVSRHNFSAQ